jgi:2-dehydropantoate 2-reductase
VDLGVAVGQRVAVVGTGANGAAIAADLTRAGLDVALIDQWPAHVEAMRVDGVRVEMPDSSVTTRVDAFHLCDVATMRHPFDIVLVAMKAYDTRWACELIRPLLTPQSLVVGVQNGMTIDDMAAVVGPQRTIGCVIEVAANMFEPGVVHQQTPIWFGLGAVDMGTQSRVGEVAQVMRAAGAVTVTEEVRSAKWMKLVANAAELGPSAILNLPLADAIAVPGMHDFMVRAGQEAARTAVALGHRLMPIFGVAEAKDFTPEKYAVELLNGVLADYTLPDTRTTVLQDWMKGRRAEVEEINGLVVRSQQALGGSAPVNDRILEVARRIERRDIGPDPSNVRLLVS